MQLKDLQLFSVSLHVTTMKKIGPGFICMVVLLEFVSKNLSFGLEERELNQRLALFYKVKEGECEVMRFK